MANIIKITRPVKFHSAGGIRLLWLISWLYDHTRPIMRLKNFSLTYGTQIFRSFADEARVRIIHLLYKNDELSISDLESILDFTQTKTSRHIGYLRNSGLVGATKRDQWVFYSIKDEVYDMVSQIFDFLNKDVTLQRDQEIYQVMNSNRELAINKLAAKGYRN